MDSSSLGPGGGTGRTTRGERSKPWPLVFSHWPPTGLPSYGQTTICCSLKMEWSQLSIIGSPRDSPNPFPFPVGTHLSAIGMTIFLRRLMVLGVSISLAASPHQSHWSKVRAILFQTYRAVSVFLVSDTSFYCDIIVFLIPGLDLDFCLPSCVF